MIGSPLGSAIGFPLMIYLETTFGWRSAFMFLAVLNELIILPLVLVFLRDQPPGASPLVAAPTTPAETMGRPSDLSQVAIGALIAHTGSFDAGLMVLVGATIAGSAAMIPLVRRY
jgi:predicted MFS family arabinose efflux permease